MSLDEKLAQLVGVWLNVNRDERPGGVAGDDGPRGARRSTPAWSNEWAEAAGGRIGRADILPLVILFRLQRYWRSGITTGALKQ